MLARAAHKRGTAALAAAATAAALLTLAPVGGARATVSGLDGLIAYAGALDNDYDIYVVDPAGGTPKNLTRTPANNERDPVWSPAGDRIAFARAQSHLDVWVMNSDGSEPVNLTPGANDGMGNAGRRPAWSPDGLLIAYEDSGDIWSMNADGSDKHNLTGTPAVSGLEGDPMYSPDGSRIVYVRDLDLWVMDADGGNQHALVQAAQAERSPDWSPDGLSVVYERNGEVWQVDADGTGAAALFTSGQGGGTGPAYSPQGDQVTFATTGLGAHGGSDIAVIGADGSDARLVAGTETLTDLEPSWQAKVDKVNLGVTVVDTPDPAHVDEDVSYVVTVANAFNEARAVALGMAVPSGAAFVSATPEQGTCTRRRSTVTCQLGTLPGGTDATVTLVVTPTSTFDLVLSGAVTSGNPDPDPTNNAFREETAVLPPPGVEPRSLITWSVPDRYADHDGDGFLDENRFTNPKGAKVPFEMVLHGCDSSPLGAITSYRFVVTLPSGQRLTQSSPSCDFAFEPPKEGTYPVQLEITTTDGTTVKSKRDVPFRDYFIVSLGDSIASGEGNPDRICDQGCHWWDPPETWQDRPCHRSALSGPSRAAQLIEEGDPTTSVTFVHLACSGAQVTKGILEAWPGIEPDGSKLVRPQIDVMRDLIKAWGRKPDAVLVSIGANDAEFADAVLVCLLDGRCQNDKDFVKKVKQRLARLPDRYARLDKALDGQGIAGRKVFITEYPDVTKDHEGEYSQCLPWLYPSEWEWADKNVVQPLNDAVRRAANKDSYGWNVVGGIYKGFHNHGYCATLHWIVRLEESIDRQGDQNGAFHPNGPGHTFYGQQIAAAVLPRLD